MTVKLPGDRQPGPGTGLFHWEEKQRPTSLHLSFPMQSRPRSCLTFRGTSCFLSMSLKDQKVLLGSVLGKQWSRDIQVPALEGLLAEQRDSHSMRPAEGWGCQGAVGALG